MTTSDLQYVRVIDSRMDVNATKNRMYGILAGAPYQTYQVLPSTSFSNSQITWNAPPPSRDVYVNRKFYCRMRFRIDFVGVSAGPGIPLLQAFGMNTAPGVSPGTQYYDAPRCMPLSQAMQTIQITLNNQSFSSNLNTYSRFYQSYARDEFDEDGEYSASPSMPDQSQSYAQLNLTNRDPLADYGTNPSQCPRGTFAGCTILSNTSTGIADTASVEMEFTEAIPLSPMSFGKGQEEVAFIGINMIQVQAQLGGRGSGLLTGLAQSLWSHSTLGSALTTANATVLGGDLLFNYLTPSNLQYLPPLVTYNYYEPTLYPTTSANPIAPGQTIDLFMSSVTLPTIPNELLVAIDCQDSQTNITDTDTYCAINRVNITYANLDGILSNATPQDLYNMCVRNGINYDFTQFRQFKGALLCIKFGTDIPLKDQWAPGLRTSQTLQMTVNCTNIHPTKTFIPTLRVVAMQEGIVTVDNGSVSKNIGVLDEKTVLDSWDSIPIPYKPTGNIFGGSLAGGFWDDVATFAKRVGRAGINVAKQVAPAPFQPIVREADALAQSYGFGLRDMSRHRGAALLM